MYTGKRAGERPVSYWAVLAFMAAFAAVLVGVSWYFLIPALDAARNAPKADQHKLAAYAALLLAVVLFVLLGGLLLTFRIGRFFFPRPSPPRTQTPYVDAWAESAKRLQPPKDS